MAPEAPSHLTQSWLIVLNPTAGGGLVRRCWPELYRQLAPHLPEHQVQESQYRGHITELVQQGIRDGIRCILAVGGDGTNHEAVNGIMQAEEVPSREMLYALLPIGTGNDWIKTHGIPARFEEWLRLFLAGKIQEQNIGRLDYQAEDGDARRYFVNVAGLAYDGYVVRYTEHKKPLFSGKIYYLSVIMLCLFRYRLQRGRIRFDGQQVNDRFYTINAGIGRYSGGGMQLVPQAEPAGDQLALTYAGPVTKLGVIFNTYRFYNGSLGRHPKVTTTSATEIHVDAAGDGPLLLEADGEFLGETPVTITFHRKALRFIGP